jgi:hypothetical protein
MIKRFSFYLIISVLICISVCTLAFDRQKNKAPHNLAICAMFKNESPWLKEWIEYHRLMGVSKFYLYNNDSTDSFLDILTPYLQSGLVELIDWSSSTKDHAIYGVDDYCFVPFQIGAYNDCLKKRALGAARWVAIIDIDEFIVAGKGCDSLLSLLEHSESKKVGALLLNWRCFGTSHVEELAQGDLLLHKLFLRTGDDHPWNKHTKGIYQPKAVKFCAVHNPKKMRKGYRVKNINPKKMVINHYWTRTEKVLKEKRKISNDESRVFFDIFNQQEDYTVFPLIPDLRNAVFSKSN